MRKLERKVKVLIGIPIHLTQEIPKELKQDLARLRGNFDILFMRDLPEDAYKGDRVYRIAKARERIRREFLTGDYSHLLFLDSDIGFPAETLEILLAYDADIVTHRYPGKFKIARKIKATKFQLGEPVCELDGKGGLSVLTGLGCSLIKRRVLEKIDFIEDLEEENDLGEDILFRYKVRKNGFTIIDLKDKLELKHLPYDFKNFLEQWVSREKSGQKVRLEKEEGEWVENN